MTCVPNASAILKFVSTTTGNNITWGGKNTPGTLTFDGVGGAWQFQDAPGAGNSSTVLTLTNGSLDLNAKAFTGGLSSSNSNTRTLTLGAMTWTLAANLWDIGTSTGMTFSGASSTITVAGSAPNANFNGGGLTYNAVNWTLNQTSTVTVNQANTFATLTMSCGANTGSTYSLGANQTVTGTFTSSGNTTINRNFICSATRGTARTITAATVTVTHTDFRDITGAGAGSWDFSGLTATANGNGGGNSGITFTTPKSCYMKTAVSVNWSGSNWFTASGGSTAIVPAVPLIHDSAIFDANSVTAGSKIITTDLPRLPGSNWTGVLNTPAWATAFVGQLTGTEVYGSIVLVSGMTHTGGQPLFLCGSGSSSLNGGGLTWPASTTLNVNCGTGTYSLAANLSSSSGITITSGTLAEAEFTVSATAINVNGGTWSGSGAITGTTCTVAGGTFSPTSLLTLTGALAISSGTFNVASAGVTGHTTCTVSSTGTLNLAGQVNGSGAVNVTGGTVGDTGTSGELKGTTGSFSGGTSTVHKLTLSSTFAQSSTASLTVPANGSATWATTWTWTGTTFTFTTGGTPTWSSGALSVSAAGGAYTFNR